MSAAEGSPFPSLRRQTDPSLLRTAVQKSLLNYRSVPRESDAAHCFGTMSRPNEEEKRESCPFFCPRPPRLTLCPPREWYFQFDRAQLRHPRGKVISLAIAETRTDEPTMQEQKRYRRFLSLSPSPSIIRPLFGNKRLIRFDVTWNMNSRGLTTIQRRRVRS